MGHGHLITAEGRGWTRHALDEIAALCLEHLGEDSLRSQTHGGATDRMIRIGVAAPPDGAQCERDMEIRLREGDDRAAAATRIVAAILRREQAAGVDPRDYHCHVVVERAVAAGRCRDVTQGRLVTSEGQDRVERYGRSVTTASILLAPGVRFSQGDSSCTVQIADLDLPDTVLRALPGEPVGRIVSHPWLEHHGMTVTRASTNGRRTVLTVPFVWGSIPGPR